MSKIKAIRGMNDLLPEQSPVWQYLESTLAEVLRAYHYREIRFPLLEKTELFKRSIGEVTDIVEKEMYTFNDRNDESLTLRPEGTASCVRACEEHGLLYNQIQRLWYTGPMFRYEKPQKGRLRQFHQLGVEAFGMQGPDIDAEVILISARFWKKLGIADAVTLELNSIGTLESRGRYRDALVAYLQARKSELDEDSQRRLDSNPLRILDSKDANTQALLDGAPSLQDYLDEESKAHFAGLIHIIEAAGLKYVVNPRLVRGLDYYSKTVFEWTTDRLGAQGTVCAGGRYDGLVEQLGGRPTPAVGFAMGIERLALMLEALDVVPDSVDAAPDLFCMAMGEGTHAAAVQLVEKLRDTQPDLVVQMHCGGGSFKSQMKKADKSGARFALILGENELQSQTVMLKPLRGEGEQQAIAFADLNEALARLVATPAQ